MQALTIIFLVYNSITTTAILYYMVHYKVIPDKTIQNIKRKMSIKKTRIISPSARESSNLSDYE